MKTVLIVDDSQIVLTLLEEKIKKVLNVTILKALSYKEAVKHISEQDIIHIAILDINLPDAKEGQIIDYAISKDIPSVILTGLMNENLKQTILQKDIIDYVIKSDLNSMDYTVNIVNRVLSNYDRNILVVDDSKFQRSIVVQMLEKMKVNIVTASNGEEALKLILNQQDNKFSLVLTDYNMPKMDGLELTLNIRNLYKKDQLSVIVMSTTDDLETASKFIKIGANDFIQKPFTQTEFVARVNANLDLLDLFEKTKMLVTKDYLTSSYNRTFFIESGESIVNKVKRRGKEIAVAMVDIDDFQEINEKYGYEVGDHIIQHVSKTINSNLRSSDLISRFKDDEFAILLEDLTLDNASILFKKIKKSLTQEPAIIGDLSISFHVSIGIFYGLEENLNSMIKKAIISLEYAKNNGKQQIVINEH